ncbi:pyridoxamine 5'-phosphate oxidase family protein [Microbacterium sp.]|uniref:pyridoxamine 5'-phosphate oxidase family protein n=1 Tax=Microbacterium sp. TaxID=51671 RepID=UPI0032219F5C
MDTADQGPIDRPLSNDVEGLRLNECWEVLASLTIGRLAVLGADGAPDLFPVDYLTHGERIYVRTAPGSKLMDVARDPRVAFEVDAVGDGLAWSVVVRGTAARLDADDEIEESGVLDLQSTNPTVKSNFVRITPREINGRRFRTVSR